jgi:protease-4
MTPLVSSWLALSVLSVPIPLRLTADVDDPYAVLVNPAGLAFGTAQDARLVLGHASFFGSGAFAKSELPFRVLGGFALELDDHGSGIEPRLSFGLGRTLGPLALGLAYSASAGAQVLTAGAMLRPWRWLSVGGTAINLAASDGPRAYETGLALRFFSDRLLLSTRLRAIEGKPLAYDDGNYDVVTRAQVEIVEGILLGAGVDLRGRLSAQLVIGFGHPLGGAYAQTGVRVNGPVAGGVELGFRREPFSDLLYRNREVTSLLVEPSLAFLEQMRELSRDDAVRVIRLRIAPLGVGWGVAHEIQSEMLRARKPGRRIECELADGSMVGMYIASACTSISVRPSWVMFAEPPTIRGVGVSGASMHPFAQAIGLRAIEVIAGVRGLSVEVVRDVLARGAQSATVARGLRFVDEVKAEEGAAYETPVHGARGHFVVRRKIAVVAVDGVISRGDSAIVRSPSRIAEALGARAGEHALTEALDQLESDPRIAAVVVRIDSPGGDLGAAQAIADRIKAVDRTKPVVASYGDAAEGAALLLGAAARRVFASPTTLVGTASTSDDVTDLDDLVPSRWMETSLTSTSSRASPLDTGTSAVKTGLVKSHGGLLDAIDFARQEAHAEDAASLLIDLPSREPPRQKGPQSIGFVLVP